MTTSNIINELGEDVQQYFGAVSPPIFQTVNFSFNTVAEMREAIANEYETPFYTRGNNPTIDLLNKKMAALEKTEAALTFSSGSTAVAAAILGNVSQGGHVVCVTEPYSWTAKLLDNFAAKFGVKTTYIDGTKAENYEAAIRPNTQLLFLESPNSFTFELQDIAAVTEIAKRHGILTVMDNSYASPLNQNPATYGVDMVVHSATKYISGHSDAIAGVVCGSEAMMRKLFSSQLMAIGGVISPFNAWLLLRGLRTLPLRMDRVAQTAGEVCSFLQSHPKVAKVCYPFLPTHPQYELAKKQMKQGAGQFSIQLKTQELDKVELFCNTLERFRLGASWGGYESLMFPSCTFNQEAQNDTGYPLNFVRYCVGLEPPEELIADLEQALARI